jgi:hypothetical protein
VSLVAQFGENPGQFTLREPVDQIRGGRPERGIKAHVERAISHEREAAGAIVHLVARKAKVSEHQICGAARSDQQPRKEGEVARDRIDLQHVCASTRRLANPGRRALKIGGVGIIENDAAAGLEPGCH